MKFNSMMKTTAVAALLLSASLANAENFVSLSGSKLYLVEFDISTNCPVKELCHNADGVRVDSAKSAEAIERARKMKEELKVRDAEIASLKAKLAKTPDLQKEDLADEIMAKQNDANNLYENLSSLTRVPHANRNMENKWTYDGQAIDFYSSAPTEAKIWLDWSVAYDPSLGMNLIVKTSSPNFGNEAMIAKCQARYSRHSKQFLWKTEYGDYYASSVICTLPNNRGFLRFLFQSDPKVDELIKQNDW
jgi:hypothetical protein